MKATYRDRTSKIGDWNNILVGRTSAPISTCLGLMERACVSLDRRAVLPVTARNREVLRSKRILGLVSRSKSNATIDIAPSSMARIQKSNGQPSP
jgi:hypothetical protein